jgi:hypothetical protein
MAPKITGAPPPASMDEAKKRDLKHGLRALPYRFSPASLNGAENHGRSSPRIHGRGQKTRLETRLTGAPISALPRILEWRRKSRALLFPHPWTRPKNAACGRSRFSRRKCVIPAESQPEPPLRRLSISGSGRTGFGLPSPPAVACTGPLSQNRKETR